VDARLTATAGVQSRYMGEQERLLHYMHGMGGLIAVTVLTIRGPLGADLVQGGLDYIQQRHAMLRVHIRYRRRSFRRQPPFVVVEPELDLAGTTAIPLTELTGDWEELVRTELRTPMPRGLNPRMRAVLVRPGADGVSRLILTTDHAIADAQASCLAVRDLMAFFADPSLPASPPSGLGPALETIYPKKPDSGTKAYEPAIRLPHPRRPKGQRDTLYEWRQFSVAETDAIRATARAHRTTMHGAMTAAVLQAVNQQYGLVEMTCASTMEFRRLSRPPLPADTFGCFVDVVRTRHALGGPFWALAQEVAFKLIATIAKDQKTSSLLALPSFEVYRHELMPTLRSGLRIDGVGVTSAGDTGLRRHYGRFELVDIIMLVSVHVVGPGVFAVGLEREGELSLGLCYASKTLAPEEVAELIDRSAAILRNLPA
jgi:hypothetical protein